VLPKPDLYLTDNTHHLCYKDQSQIDVGLHVKCLLFYPVLVKTPDINFTDVCPVKLTLFHVDRRDMDSGCLSCGLK